jgi:hypothetical protein
LPKATASSGSCWFNALIERHASRPSQVTTVMIQNVDHMYSGQEEQLADVIAGWIAALR